jgi:hypothetical protein
MVLDLNVFWFFMKHWILWELHMTLVITMNSGGIQHMSKWICKELVNPHYFMDFHTQCNVLCFCNAQNHKILFPATPGNHGRSQSEATPEGALPIHCAPYPIKVSISLQSHVNIRIISRTISNCASWVSQHMLHNNPVCLSWLTHKLSKCTHCIANIWSGVNHIHQWSN